MDKLETRRTNPVAHFALLAVAILVVFETLVICGAFELKAQTVEKYAPWAYEPFLRLVGEHPESAPRWVAVERPRKAKPAETAVAGLASSALPLPVETNLVLEATVPLEAEPDPVAAPTNPPPANRDEIIPVG